MGTVVCNPLWSENYGFISYCNFMVTIWKKWGMLKKKVFCSMSDERVF